jgi:hypothetical protein
MKSERAKKRIEELILIAQRNVVHGNMFTDSVYKIVELAEEDAESRQKAYDREKAILSYCVACGPWCEGYFDNGNSCDRGNLDVFLSRYDNE